jgi:diadenosine tetraphosphatase ApaH/serine/threonine PP2A family protein phosphatase
MKLYPTYTSPYKGEGYSRDVGAVWRQRGEASIVEWTANCEMIERLPLGLRVDPKYPMHRIIKETADTC